MIPIHTEAGEKTPQRDLLITLIHTEVGEWENPTTRLLMALIHTEAGENTPQRDLIITRIHTEASEKTPLQGC